MGAKGRSLIGMEKDVEVHDGGALTAWKCFQGDAVIAFKVGIVHAVRHTGTAVGGIVGVIGRALGAQAGTGGHMQLQLAVSGIAETTLPFMVPAFQIAADGQCLMPYHGL